MRTVLIHNPGWRFADPAVSYCPFRAKIFTSEGFNISAQGQRIATLGKLLTALPLEKGRPECVSSSLPPFAKGGIWGDAVGKIPLVPL